MMSNYRDVEQKDCGRKGALGAGFDIPPYTLMLFMHYNNALIAECCID